MSANIPFHDRKYVKVMDREPLMQDDFDQHISPRRGPQRDRILYALIFIATHVACLLTGLWFANTYFAPDLRSCVNYTSHDSPLLHDLEIKYHKVRYNGSFLHENIYRRNASLEVDAAWSALGVDYRAMLVPDSQTLTAGISPSQVHISAKHGGGAPANLEGLHHLHCLNLLRKALPWNIAYYKALGKGAFTNPDHILKLHVTHCLDILRQQLMCTVDVGVLGQVWWQGPSNKDRMVASGEWGQGDAGADAKGPFAFVDFNTDHVCRNFEDIRRWAEGRQLPMATPEGFLEWPSPGDVLDEIP